MKPQAAVLTGDLISSTKAPPEAADSAIAQIEAIASQLQDVASFTRYRGDGWQLYLEKPGLALATALLIFAKLRALGGLESRISIGLGGAYLSSGRNFHNVQTISAANGTAFVFSGQTLDLMPKNRRLVISGEGVDRLHSRLVALIDDRIFRWSQEQAQVAALALAPKPPTTQLEIAENLGISRQAVALRLKAANFTMLNAAANDFLDHFGEVAESDD